MAILHYFKETDGLILEKQLGRFLGFFSEYWFTCEWDLAHPLVVESISTEYEYYLGGPQVLTVPSVAADSSCCLRCSEEAITNAFRYR